MKEIRTTEAARRFDVHPNFLNKMLNMGRLEGRKDVNGHWWIDLESLERWNARRQRRARSVDVRVALLLALWGKPTGNHSEHTGITALNKRW